jgi:hypothetical protein
MNPKLATHWPWTALFCAALSGCDSPPPAPSTTPAAVVPTPTPCPLEGMPFMVSETGTRPEADLLVEPNKRNPFRTSASYGNLDLTSWLANKDVDALSFGLDWVATQDPAYWRLTKFVSGSPISSWEGWGAILYGDHRMIHAYAWGDPSKLGAVNLAVGHQTLHDMTPYGIERIDAIDFNAWVFSGPPSSVCYAPHPPAAGQAYDPTLVYSIPGPAAGTTADVNNSGATLWGVKAVEEGGVWAWHGPFVVAPPGDLGLQLSDDIDTLALDRRQGRLMFSLTTTNLKVMLVNEKPSGEAFMLTMKDVAQELETSDGIKFVASVPLTSKPSTACAIDPSKFNWRGLRGGLPKEAQAARE